MKLFKYLFFLLLIVIIGGSIYVATLDGNYQAEESIVIPAPKKMIFNEVNNYRYWENWDPWLKKKPDSKITYPEKTSGEGASYAWVGTSPVGHMFTQEVVPSTKITQNRITSHTFGQAKRHFYWHFKTVDKGTKVTWGVKGEQSFMEKAFEVREDSSLSKRMKPLLKDGLNGLKNEILKKMQVHKVNVDGVTQYGGGYYMYSTTASKNNPSAIASKLAKIIPDVRHYMTSNDIQKSGSGLAVYNKIDEQNGSVIISAGIPTPSQVATPGDSSILCGFVESQKVLKTTLKGNYSNLDEAWKAANDYINAHDNIERIPDGTPIEVFVNDPNEVANPANWVTELYIPIQEKESSTQGTSTEIILE